MKLTIGTIHIWVYCRQPGCGVQYNHNNKKFESRVPDLVRGAEQIKYLAENFKTELDQQNKILEKINRDTAKYEIKMKKIDNKFDKVIAASNFDQRVKYYVYANIALCILLLILQ